MLGEHVTQKGSLVDSDKLRFDFSHYESVTPDELQRIEDLVNREVRANNDAETRVMPYDDAIEAGAIALFGEKYDTDVRVLRLGEFSTELCGGTHVSRTGDIGLFKITAETSVASGVRRIEAVTGEGALAEVRRAQQSLAEVAGLVRASREEAVQKVGQVLARNKALEKELTALKAKLAAGGGSDLTEQATDVGDMRVLSARMDGIDAKSLRDAIDRLRDKLGSRSVVVLGAVEDGKVRLAAGVSKAITDRVPAGDLVRHVAEAVGGKGGGRADFAQAGGSRPEDLDAALAGVSDWVAARTG